MVSIMALDETTKTAVLTRKKLIIESIVTALMVIILVVLVSINKVCKTPI